LPFCREAVPPDSTVNFLKSFFITYFSQVCTHNDNAY
jgi:hypothetical protein